MLKYQIAALLIMAFFYAIYLGKMIAQKRQGIVTNQIGKDQSDKKRLQEEKYLSGEFGETYSAYKKHVHRYIGRKSCVFLKVER